MASIWDTLFPNQDYRTAAPSGGYADLYANSLLGNRTDTPTSVGAMETGKDFIPVLSDVLAFGEAGHALSEGDRKTAAILAAGGLLSTIPGLGPTLARPVMAAGRKAADVASRIEVDPNAVGSLLGNVRVKPKSDMADNVTSFPVMQGRSKKGLDNFFNPDGLSWGTTSRETAEQFAGRNEVYWPNRTPPESSVEFSGDVYDLNFDLKNPMDVDISQTLWDRDRELALVSEAKSAGYDGLRISHPSGKVDYVAFDPSQVSRVAPSTPAEEIAGLLSSGRADDVTDEMLGKLTAQDNSELFDLYQSGATGMDLPMDEASRMARAEAAGFEGGLLHGTGSDIAAVDKSKLGQKQNVLGEGFYSTTNPKRSNRYVPKENRDGELVFSDGGNVMPLMSRNDNVFDLEAPTGSANASSIGSAFEGAGFDVEYRGGGDQVFIKNKSNPDQSVYLDSYQPGQTSIAKLKDVFGNNNVTKIMEEAGFSGLSNSESLGSKVAVNYNPEDVRSKFARFDPRLSNLKNLSAGVGAAPIGLLALREEQKRANEEQYKRGLLQ